MYIHTVQNLTEHPRQSTPASLQSFKTKKELVTTANFRRSVTIPLTHCAAFILMALHSAEVATVEKWANGIP